MSYKVEVCFTRLLIILGEVCNGNGSHNLSTLEVGVEGFPQRQKSASLVFFQMGQDTVPGFGSKPKWMGYDNRRTQPLVTNTFSFSGSLTAYLRLAHILCVCVCCILTLQAYWGQQPFYLADILYEPTN